MRLIAKFLRQQGHKVWVDNEKLIPGTPVWEDAVEKGIKDASAVVVVLSPDSKNSEWVRREISLADQHHKRVFPVLVRGDENSSISLRLINRQFVDLREDVNTGLKSLSDAIAFYISELNLQNKVTPDQTGSFKYVKSNIEPPASQPLPKNKPSQLPVADDAKKTISQPYEASPSRNVFGWLTGGSKGEATRLINQLADSAKRDKTAQDLIRLGADAVPPLIEALQTRDLNLLAIYEQILARIPSAAPALIKLLQTGHPVLRARAADIFAISRDRSAVPALLDALQGEYFTVRARAAIALGRLGETQALPPILKLLKDPEGEVRIAACLALGLYKDPSTFDDITNILLDDPKIEVRQAAAQALGHTQHPAALPYLMEALHDSFWWYEREAQAGDLFTAIEKMGAAAVESLIAALKDPEGAVRRYAALVLGRIGDPRAIEPLGMALYDLHHEVGKASAEALVKFGVGSFEILVEALDHPEMWIRIHSVDILPKVKEPRVGLVLLEMLKDPEREVRKHVLEALGELKDPRTIPALQDVMAQRGDRELHALAKSALEKIGS